MPETAHSAIAVVGIDIGKNSFHVVGLNERGMIVMGHLPIHSEGVALT